MQTDIHTFSNGDLAPELDPEQRLCARDVDATNGPPDARVNGSVDDVVDGRDGAQGVGDGGFVEDIGGCAGDGERGVRVLVFEQGEGGGEVCGGGADDMDVCAGGEEGFGDA